MKIEIAKAIAKYFVMSNRLDEMGNHLQRYIEEAVKCNEDNPEEFYWMVVRSTEVKLFNS